MKKNLIQTVVPEDRGTGTSDGRLSRAAHSSALRSSLPFNSIQHLILPSPHSVLKLPSFSLSSHSLHKGHIEYHQLKTAHSTVDTYDLNSMHTDMHDKLFQKKTKTKDEPSFINIIWYNFFVSRKLIIVFEFTQYAEAVACIDSRNADRGRVGFIIYNLQAISRQNRIVILDLFLFL